MIFKFQKKSTPHFGVQTPYLAAVVKGTSCRGKSHFHGDLIASPGSIQGKEMRTNFVASAPLLVTARDSAGVV